MITGVNHVTLAVSDIAEAYRFYVEILGLRPAARWNGGAYLLAGPTWFAIVRDANARKDPLPEETHIAFSVSRTDYPAIVRRLKAAEVRIWRENRSEGASLYFLDPDGHKLEVHVGDLETRLSHLASEANSDLELLDGAVPLRVHMSENGTSVANEFSDPLNHFWSWLMDAERSEVDAYAMTLSTIDSGGGPSSRTVALKQVKADGLVFTSSLSGPKARELRADPRASVVFYWPQCGRQVRAQGVVALLSREAAQRLFDARPRWQQLALHAAPPSQPLTDYSALQKRLADLEALFDGRDVPLPEWGAYLLRPNVMEFWQGSDDRLHRRVRYRRQEDSTWTKLYLAP